MLDGKKVIAGDFVYLIEDGKLQCHIINAFKHGGSFKDIFTFKDIDAINMDFETIIKKEPVCTYEDKEDLRRYKYLKERDLLTNYSIELK